MTDRVAARWQHHHFRRSRSMSLLLPVNTTYTARCRHWQNSLPPGVSTIISCRVLYYQSISVIDQHPIHGLYLVGWPRFELATVHLSRKPFLKPQNDVGFPASEEDRNYMMKNIRFFIICFERFINLRLHLILWVEIINIIGDNWSGNIYLCLWVYVEWHSLPAFWPVAPPQPQRAPLSTPQAHWRENLKEQCYGELKLSSMDLIREWNNYI